MAMPTVITGRLGALVRAYKGVDAFAALVGVYPHTVWRWGTGRTTPSDKLKAKMHKLARLKKIASPYPPNARSPR